MTEEANTPQAEREHRQRVLKGATVIMGMNDSEIPCTVRNMHAHGAELKVPFEANLPREFMLHISVDNVTWLCELRWRMRERAGVRFLGQTRKPAWHYG
jgi:hypothetical protein